MTHDQEEMVEDERRPASLKVDEHGVIGNATDDSDTPLTDVSQSSLRSPESPPYLLSIVVEQPL